MRDSFNYVVVMVALWLIGVYEHTPQPLWRQLWIGLAAWVLYDIAHLLHRAYKRRKESAVVTEPL